ncbi:MAG: response regulator transcription factor [Actinomycetota bacterium]|nr:response regulator transcription factor [Actinomycetota bacterium]
MSTVLIVDDERPLLRALEINFRAHGYTVITAADGATALKTAARTPADIIILDLGLPDIDGMDVIRGLRGWTSTPIIVLSARHSSREKVQALDAGANDYVTKPFMIDELLARVRAASRARAQSPDLPEVKTAHFTVDLANQVARRGTENVRLTPTEWNILELLARNPGRLVSQQEILAHVWGNAYASESQYLRVYIGQLRRKLEPDPAHPAHLITEPGRGYRFER